MENPAHFSMEINNQAIRRKAKHDRQAVRQLGTTSHIGLARAEANYYLTLEATPPAA